MSGSITDCSAYGNEYLGYYVDIRSRIQGCHAEYNDGAGIYLRYSTQGTYSAAEENVMAGNGYGLLCDQATGNIIVRNKALNNTTNYLVGAGNSFAEVLSPGMAFTNSNPWANFSD